RQPFELLLGKSILDGDVFSFNQAKLAQFLPERVQEDRNTRSSTLIKETNAKDFPCLLRLGGRAKRREHSAKSKANDCLSHTFSTCLCSLLFDYLIRPCQHVGWNCQADLLGCFQVDDELELR